MVLKQAFTNNILPTVYRLDLNIFCHLHQEYMLMFWFFFSQTDLSTIDSLDLFFNLYFIYQCRSICKL